MTTEPYHLVIRGGTVGTSSGSFIADVAVSGGTIAAIGQGLGKGKRDPTLFDDIVADLGVRPCEALLLDDNAGNIERARSRGLSAWLFTDEAACLAQFAAILGDSREMTA